MLPATTQQRQTTTGLVGIEETESEGAVFNMNPDVETVMKGQIRGNYYWSFSLTSIGSGARWFWQVKVPLLRACVPSQRDGGE